jgi:hypothetical protein
MKKITFTIFILSVIGVLFSTIASAQLITSDFSSKAYFPIVHNLSAAVIFYNSDDAEVIKIAAGLFAEDIERVAGFLPTVDTSEIIKSDYVILIGTIENSSLIKKLIDKGVFTTDDLADKWECYKIQVIDKPFNGVKKALVVAGSDRRGAAYGLFELSRQMGVSPWYWWADVPVKHKRNLFVKNEVFISEPPSVKYRGIFLNDEDWGLQPWAAKNFESETGDIGPKTYAQIFELLLRLKGNLIWPAMHDCTKAFYHYPGNRVVADRYAIVVSSSHAEPMLRNNVDEWDKEKFGQFNYTENKEKVLEYWETRVKESIVYENIYTLGMRGIHDSQIEGNYTDAERVEIMEDIIANQQEMLRRHAQKPINEIQQAFVPYKEVLKIYNDGLKVPEEVTLTWVDDNYGYIRRLSNREEQNRKGGGGVYYHASYWGKPHDYLWLSSLSPGIMREEFYKAYQTNSRTIWVLNVGDIKPIEFDMTLYFDMANNIQPYDQFGSERDFYMKYAEEQFGSEFAFHIAGILEEYYRLSYQRRPEHTAWSQVYPTKPSKISDLNHFYYGDEAARRLRDYSIITKQVKEIRKHIAPEYSDAFYQLVYYPVVCADYINQKKFYHDKAQLYGQMGRLSAKEYYRRAENAYNKILEETDFYNNELAGGKWKYMMTMNPRDLEVFHQPIAPEYKKVDDKLWGIQPEGYTLSDSTFIIDKKALLQLPDFTPWGSKKYFVDIFLLQDTSISWSAKTSEDWIKLNKSEGKLGLASGKSEERIWVTIDRSELPDSEELSGSLVIKAGKEKRKVQLRVIHQLENMESDSGMFIESNGYISMFGGNPSHLVNNTEEKWQVVEGIGYSQKCLAGMPFHVPAITGINEIKEKSPVAEYDFYTFTEFEPVVHVFSVPTYPLNNNYGLRYAIAIDEEPIQIIHPRINKKDGTVYFKGEQWCIDVLRNACQENTEHQLLKPGKHTLRIYMVDPGVIIDRILIDLGELRKSYLPVPETKMQE